jgi:CheY-like chemotaxis protein
MSPEVQVRLFEPFFTTKPTGQGTGLGLATVHGIVEQSDGFIVVNSAPNRGTTLEVYWPHFSATEDSDTERQSESVSPTAWTGTILLVEDDPIVQLTVCSTLERLGYAVITANSGRKALARIQEKEQRPEVVLTDVVMPDMSGRELAEQLWQKYPGIKVIFMSGYTADAILRHGIAQEEVAFLQKPFTREMLQRTLQSLLGRCGDEAPAGPG